GGDPAGGAGPVAAAKAEPAAVVQKAEPAKVEPAKAEPKDPWLDGLDDAITEAPQKPAPKAAPKQEAGPKGTQKIAPTATGSALPKVTPEKVAPAATTAPKVTPEKVAPAATAPKVAPATKVAPEKIAPTATGSALPKVTPAKVAPEKVAPAATTALKV